MQRMCVMERTKREREARQFLVLGGSSIVQNTKTVIVIIFKYWCHLNCTEVTGLLELNRVALVDQYSHIVLLNKRVYQRTIEKGNILHQRGRKRRANCLPQQVSSSERSDRIKNRDKAWACGFGRGPNIVKNRLISIGSHSHRERLDRPWQDREEPSSFLFFKATSCGGKVVTEVNIDRKIYNIVFKILIQGLNTLYSVVTHH